jgi:beta-lactam-binding protein with PASTA domain
MYKKVNKGMADSVIKNAPKARTTYAQGTKVQMPVTGGKIKKNKPKRAGKK